MRVHAALFCIRSCMRVPSLRQYLPIAQTRAAGGAGSSGDDTRAKEHTDVATIAHPSTTLPSPLGRTTGLYAMVWTLRALGSALECASCPSDVPFFGYHGSKAHECICKGGRVTFALCPCRYHDKICYGSNVMEGIRCAGSVVSCAVNSLSGWTVLSLLFLSVL